MGSRSSRSRATAGSWAESFRSARLIINAINDFRPDVLHAHYAGRLASLASLSGVRPFVLTVMGGDVLFEQQEHPTGLDRWMTRRLLERADLILAKSEHLAGTIRELGDFAAKTQTIVWGVDLATFPGKTTREEARSALGFSPAHKVILSPRILRPLYNIHLLIEALPFLLQNVTNVVLMLTRI